MVPKSPIEAMANNEILQVLVFSSSSAARSARWANRARLTKVIDQLAQVMLRITGTVMNLAPLAVFAAMASVITTNGLGILAPSPNSWAASIWRWLACGRCWCWAALSSSASASSA
jgi:Na+/H+-dicarboxylate symporter